MLYAYTLWVNNFEKNCSILHRFKDKCVFGKTILHKKRQITLEIPLRVKNVGRQKWQENNSFLQKVPHDCVYPGGKKFVKIALYHTIPEINGFCIFQHKLKTAAKNGRKIISGKKYQMTLQIPGVKKFSQNRSMLHHF